MKIKARWAIVVFSSIYLVKASKVWYNDNMMENAKEPSMPALPECFTRLVLEGYTVRRIRQEAENLGECLDAFTDTVLIIEMLRIKQECS